MTVSEIYRRVAQIGEQSSLDYNRKEAFYGELNEAIQRIATIMPVYRTVPLVHEPPETVWYCELIRHRGGEDTIIGDDAARAWTLSTGGAGSIFVQQEIDGEWQSVRSYTIETEWRTYKGVFPEGRSRLKIVSDYKLTIIDAAMYSELTGANDEDVQEYSLYSTYNMNDIVGDFGAFTNPPIRAENDAMIDPDVYRIIGQNILIKRENKGVYWIKYRTKPEKINEKQKVECDDTEINIYPGTEEALIMLVASYEYRLDESGLGQQMAQEYNNRVAEMLALDKDDKTQVRYIKSSW